MDCEQFDKSTMSLLYGELEELSEGAAMRHLHHCSRCRKIWDGFRDTRETLDLRLDELPPDLFEGILKSERSAHHSLPVRERFSRAISIMAGYAMRPQVAMAAILLVVIGSSLVFFRTEPNQHGQISVTELGSPMREAKDLESHQARALVFERRKDETFNVEPASSPQPGSSPMSAPASSSASAKVKNFNQIEQKYAEAMSAYQNGRYAEAERIFSEVANVESPKSAVAALHQGHAARNGSGCQQAATLYDAVAARYVNTSLADEATWNAASCYRAMGQKRRAYAHYLALQGRPTFAKRATKAIRELKLAPQAEETRPKNLAEKKPTTEEANSAPKKARAQKQASPPARGSKPAIDSR